MKTEALKIPIMELSRVQDDGRGCCVSQHRLEFVGGASSCTFPLDAARRRNHVPCFICQNQVYRILCLVLILVLSCHADFYDPMVNDRAKIFEYLDGVENAVGLETFESVPTGRVQEFAKTLGPIDRKAMLPSEFIGRLRHLGTVEKRFYREKPLSEEDVLAYLMPLRIRYEATSHPEWPERLAVHFKDVASKATTADACAKGILGWVARHLVLTDPEPTYRLPMRGDLDPLTVLKGGRGSEIDLAIFGVAALRSCGVAARLVWAPALRNEVGGKVWLEYQSESGTWVSWVPSYGAPADHLARMRRELGPKIVLVLASPDAPVEITGNYVETVQIHVRTGREDAEVAFMVVGSEGLMPIRGTATEYAKNEREAVVGRGPLIVASTSSNRRAFALLPVEMSVSTREITILADDGNLSVQPPIEPISESTKTP